MAKPLRIGVAGVGVVGGALAGLLSRRRADLATRTGRDIVITAFSARKTGARGLPLGEAVFFGDPRDLAKHSPVPRQSADSFQDRRLSRAEN